MKRQRFDFKRFKIKKIMNLPDTITFLNLLFGMASIFFSVHRRFYSASIMLVIALVMDYLDGKAASLLNQKTEFGKNADSLADLVSFGVAPCVFGYFYYTTFSMMPITLLLISISFFIISGLVRLAQYNVINYHKKFIGVPITINGLIFPVLFFIGYSADYLYIIYFLSGILMVSNVKIKRRI